NEGGHYDAIMLLEPSSPFATPDHMAKAIDLYQSRAAELVVGMRRTETPSLFVGEQTHDDSIADIVENMRAAPKQRRQDQPGEWTMNGALYLVSWEAFKRSGKIYGAAENSYGLLMDRWHSLEIETPDDLLLAEFAVANGMIDLSSWRS
ncbi:MAG: hypothetical protein RLN70_10335, partial [Rhodospirillaceae bacterium]